jgi:uncharacterized protein YrrD
MLLKASSLNGLTLAARDGEIGSVSDLLFEDDTWRVRWLVVETGHWLSRHSVLLPASHVGTLSSGASAVPVDVSMSQVENSPGAGTDLPVSRQLESEMYNHFGWPPYWTGASASYLPPMGAAGVAYPFAGALPGTADPASTPAAQTEGASSRSGDPHLRSASEVTGYYVYATDGDLGHVDDLLIDGQDWVLRYLIVDTGRWWPGRKVLVARDWISGIVWTDEAVRVARTREQIRNAPEYDPDRPVDSAYEAELHSYHGTPMPSAAAAAASRSSS